VLLVQPVKLVQTALTVQLVLLVQPVPLVPMGLTVKLESRDLLVLMV
jgi:hypothetical protein